MISDSSDLGGALDHLAVDRDAAARPDEHDVADTQLRHGHRFRSVRGHPLGGIREKLGERGERAARLRDRAHLEPVAEQHDRDEGGELPPDLDVEPAERARPARDERDQDRERDQRHHPGRPVAQLANRAAQEWDAAVAEHDRAEDRRDPLRARERGRRVAEPLLRIGAPDDDRNGQEQAEPEPVAEHRDGMAGVAVVGAMRWTARVGHVVPVIRTVAGVRRHTPPQYDEPVNARTWARIAA